LRHSAFQEAWTGFIRGYWQAERLANTHKNLPRRKRHTIKNQDNCHSDSMGNHNCVGNTASIAFSQDTANHNSNGGYHPYNVHKKPELKKPANYGLFNDNYLVYSFNTASC